MTKRRDHTDILGVKFGKLLVLEVPERGVYKHKCICDCGNIHLVSRNKLENGSVKSCGCSRLESMREGVLAHTRKPDYVNPSYKHGLSKTPTHNRWTGMKSRCKGTDEFTNSYYKDRGISYDPRWEKFENFLEDMGVCPEGMTLDRIDVNGDYCKENCRWVTFSEQSFNTRKQTNNTSGRTGVKWSSSGEVWVVVMNIDKKQKEIGRFHSFEKACACRAAAELEMYGYVKE